MPHTSARGRTVTCVPGSPTVHIFPNEQRTWRNGECARKPSHFDLTHSDILTKHAETDADTLVAKEQQKEAKRVAASGIKVRNAPVSTARDTPVTRKTLSASAQGFLHKLNVATHRISDPLTNGSDCRPQMPMHMDTISGKFIDTAQDPNSQELHKEELQRHRGQSFSSIANDAVRKAKDQAAKVVKRVQESSSTT